ncbi:retrotransposon protein, putative, ty1-copia subclass [Tanacetum coccineum]
MALTLNQEVNGREEDGDVIDSNHWLGKTVRIFPSGLVVRVLVENEENLLDMVRSMMNLTTLPRSFWGYALETAARILNMVPTKKVDRTPYEIWQGKAPKLSYLRSNKGLEIIQEEDTQPFENTIKEHNEVAPIEVEPQNVRVPIRRSARIPQAPDRYGYYVDVEEYELGDFDEPPNYKAALADPEFDKWLEAMNTKMKSMKDNQVWILVELPPNGQTVGSKLLLAPIRILLAISAFYDYEIWQMDVKTAFLNGHLSEDVYMVKPFDEEFNKTSFTQIPDKPCVYLKASGSNVAFLVLYVDDILLMRNNVTMLQEVKSWLCNRFRQNPGEIHWTTVKTILKYLRNTKDMVLVYGAKPKDELKVSCYTDATEYITAAKASMEAVWMRKFIDGLGGVMLSNKRPMEMLCDNEHALAIASDLRILKGARHFQRKYHYIRKVIQEGEIVLKKVHTDNNVADSFTKPMPFNKHFEHAMTIGIVPASSLM